MTELQRLARRLADDYQFECQGGPLRNCMEWRALCAAIDTLAVPPPSGASPQEPRREHTDACQDNFDRLTIGRPAIEQACICASQEPTAEASPQAETSEDRTHLHRWHRCPNCGGMGCNSAERGGNERCWHCALCSFVECVDSEAGGHPAPVSPVEPEPPTRKRPTTLELSGTMPDIDHGRNCRCAECQPTVEPEPCVWREDERGVWECTCGVWFVPTTGCLDLSITRRCENCGHRVQTIAYVAFRDGDVVTPNGSLDSE